MATPLGPEVVLSQRWVRWVRSHLALRMMVGVIAVLLPLVVVALVATLEGKLLGSISESFHHRYAVSFFVGAMCAFAAFLWAYNYTPDENTWGNRGAAAAVGVALFSTTPALVVVMADTTGPGEYVRAVTTAPPSTLDRVAGVLHFVCAVALFLVLAKFCQIWRDDTDKYGPSRHYAVCNGIILGSLVVALLAAGASVLVENGEYSDTGALLLRLLATLFLLAEVAMVEAFGYSWLIRGKADPGAAGRAVVAATGGTVAIAVIVSVQHATALHGAPAMWVRVVSGLVGLAAVAVAVACLWSQRPTDADLVESVTSAHGVSRPDAPRPPAQLDEERRD